MGLRAVKTILFVLPFCALVSADRPSPLISPPEEEIQKAIRQLGDENFYVRERATMFLWNSGRAAEPAVREAIHSNDPEVVRRARSVLDKFKWGLYPDTPKEIAELVGRYQAGDPQARRTAVQQLTQPRRRWLSRYWRLAAAEGPADDRQNLLQQLAQEGPAVLRNLSSRAIFRLSKKFWKPPSLATWSRRPGTMRCTGCFAVASMKRSPNTELDPHRRVAKRLPRSSRTSIARRATSRTPLSRQPRPGSPR